MPLPAVPGSEAAGVIEAVGTGVGHVAPGDRVALEPEVKKRLLEKIVEAGSALVA